MNQQQYAAINQARRLASDRIAIADAHFGAYRFPEGARLHDPDLIEQWDSSRLDLFKRTVRVWRDSNEWWHLPSRIEFSVQFHGDGKIECRAMEGQLAFGMPCTPAVASGLPDYIYTPAHPDEHIVWEGGSDIATCNTLADAKRVAQAIRCSGSKACIWISNGPEFDTVFTEPNI